jgi:hypothetical protein
MLFGRLAAITEKTKNTRKIKHRSKAARIILQLGSKRTNLSFYEQLLKIIYQSVKLELRQKEQW